MSLFRDLIRTPFFNALSTNSLRRRKNRISAKTLAKRKEKKRLKYINPYDVDYTGEKPFHPWMDARRTKAFFLAYQDMRNTNRFTRNVDEKDSKDIQKTSKEYSDYYYYKWITQEAIHTKFMANLEAANNEITNLPYYLRDELNKKDSIKNSDVVRPNQFIVEYWDQILRILPDDIANRIVVGKRLEKIANDELEMGE